MCVNDHVVDGVLTVNVLVSPETITAFKACDEVTANDDVPANCEFTEDVYELNDVVSNLPVPTVTPFKNNEPVMFTLPVKS